MQLNLITPVNKLSYGYVGVNLLKAITKLGVKVSLFPINRDSIEFEKHHQNYVIEAIRNAEGHNKKAPTLIVWHHHGLAKYRQFNGKHFGFPIFETDVFNDDEIINLESMNGLFVTCQWYKDIIENFTTKPVSVAHLGVDESVFGKFGIPYNMLLDGEDDVVRFLNVGKWEIRKGHDIIPEVFAEAFDGIDDVRLYMACDNIFLTEEDNNRWRAKYKERLGNKVVFLNRFKNQSDLVYWMNVADFGFFPARAEGWNMELHEMLWLQKPCVATYTSAHTAYANSSNCILIDTDKREPCFDGHFFYGQGNWAKFEKKQIDGMIDGLRSLYYYKKGNPRKLSFNFNNINKFTWQESAKSIISEIGL